MAVTVHHLKTPVGAVLVGALLALSGCIIPGCTEKFTQLEWVQPEIFEAFPDPGTYGAYKVTDETWAGGLREMGARHLNPTSVNTHVQTISLFAREDGRIQTSFTIEGGTPPEDKRVFGEIDRMFDTLSLPDPAGMPNTIEWRSVGC